MPRIPYVEDPEVTVNIFRVFGHRPDLLERYRAYGQALVTEGQIEPRSTEMVVVGVAAAVGSDYLWSHHGDLARTHGVTDDELRAIRDGKLDVLSDRERACVGFAQDIARQPVGDQEIKALVDAGLAPGEILELSLLATFYAMTARMLESLDVPLEAGRAGLEHP